MGVEMYSPELAHRIVAKALRGDGRAFGPVIDADPCPCGRCVPWAWVPIVDLAPPALPRPIPYVVRVGHA